MLPEQSSLHYQRFIPTNHSVRATLDHPLITHPLRLSIPALPQSISISPFKNPIYKNSTQSYSTHALPKFKINEKHSNGIDANNAW